MNGKWRCSADVAHCHVVGLRRKWITVLHDGDSASCRSDAKRGSRGQQFFREISAEFLKSVCTSRLVHNDAGVIAALCRFYHSASSSVRHTTFSLA